MNLIINGDAREFESGIPLPDLLKSLGLEGMPVVIEHNREALAPSEFPNRELKDGDSLEIITIAAGG